MGKRWTLASGVAVAWSLFQIYTALNPATLNPLVAVPVHVAFALALTFLIRPLRGSAKSLEMLEPSDEPRPHPVDYLLALLAFLMAAYVVLNQQRITTRVPTVDPLTPGDVFFAIATILLILEASRRALGWTLTIVVLVFLVYQFSGKWLAKVGQQVPLLFTLAHFGEPKLSYLYEVLDTQFLQNIGIFGQSSLVSYDTVFYFILFGVFLEVAGGGALFLDFATKLVGRFRGGPAKVSIISSSLFGTISGSAVANVAVDGMFTIPLMKKAGLKGAEAAAIEAAASTGGQIMPPVMGAASFLIAQFLGEPYRTVLIAAIIPAIVYYAALFFMVDLTALKYGFKGLTPEEIKVTWGDIARRLHLAIPIVVIVYGIMTGHSLRTTAMWAVALSSAIILMETVKAHYGKSEPVDILKDLLEKIFKALDDTGRQAVHVAIPCAAAGIVIGVATLTGLGLKFTSLIVTLAGGNLLVMLLLIMGTVILMGMGMPTTAAYLMASILGVPALVSLGISPLAAHMFVFYFACLSMVTPPVALAAYVAAGMAGASIWETGWKAFRNSLAGFLIAFAFVYNPSLLIIGYPLHVALLYALSALVGTYALAGCFSGYLRTFNKPWESVLLFIAAILLIAPEIVSSVVGLAVLVLVLLVQERRLRAAQVPVWQSAPES